MGTEIEKKRGGEEKEKEHQRNMDAFSKMIEDARRNKQEQVGMRSEDKYTEESDPVDSTEKKMKRLTEDWKKENQNLLQDEAKLYAQKCLEQERERELAGSTLSSASAKPNQVSTKAESMSQEATETPDDKKGTKGEQRAHLPKTPMSFSPPSRLVEVTETSDDKKGTKGEQGAHLPKMPMSFSPPSRLVEANGSSDSNKAVDNRRLVYENIWDSDSQNQPAVASTRPALSPLDDSHGPVAADVVLPWANTGSTGALQQQPSELVLEEQATTLRAEQTSNLSDMQQPLRESSSKKTKVDGQSRHSSRFHTDLDEMD